jgi:hypothetical protein
MPPASVNPEEYLLVLRARRAVGGRITAQDAVMRRTPGGRAEPAMVLAWARRKTGAARDRPWCVLAVWQDAAGAVGEGGSGRVLDWRGGWLLYVPGLLEASEAWRQTTPFWLTQREAAIVATLKAAGIRPADPSARTAALEELAEQVRATVQDLKLPGVPEFTPPRFTVTIDVEAGCVILDLREWTRWGPNQILRTTLLKRFPQAQGWANTVRISI